MNQHSAKAAVQFLSGLDDRQLRFFCENFFDYLAHWLIGTYQPATDKLDIVVSSKYKDLDAFVVMLLHIRPFFPPLVKGKTVRRISNIDKYPTRKTVVFHPRSQKKSLTSWTTGFVPSSANRNLRGTDFIMYTHHLEGTKGVLTDYLALASLVKAFNSREVEEYLISRNAVEYELKRATDAVKNFSNEQEVLMYTSKSQPLKCSWFKCDEDGNPIDDSEEAGMKTEISSGFKPYSSEAMISFMKSLSSDQLIYFLTHFSLLLTNWFQGELNGKAKSKWPDLVVGSKYTQLDALSIMMLHLRPYFPPLIQNTPIYRLTHVRALPKDSVVQFDAIKQFKPITSWTTNKNPYVEDRKQSKLDSIILKHNLSGSKGVLTDYKVIDLIVRCLESEAVKFFLKTKGLRVHRLEPLKQEIKHYTKEREVLMYSGSTPMKCTWRLATEGASMKTQVAASSAKVKLEAKIVGDTFYFGVQWDKYTPQVEAQLTKDMIAMLDQAQKMRLKLVIVTESNEADRVLLVLGVKRIPLSTFATMWILYRTIKDSAIPVPEHAINVLVREMYVTVAPPVLDDGRHAPYALQPQGRVAPPRLGVNRPAPNSTAKPDYALILLWC